MSSSLPLLAETDHINVKGRKIVVLLSQVNILLSLPIAIMALVELASTPSASDSNSSSSTTLATVIALVCAVVMLLLTSIPSCIIVAAKSTTTPSANSLLFDYLIAASNLLTIGFTLSVRGFPALSFLIMYGAWIGIAGPTLLRPLNLLLIAAHLLLVFYNFIAVTITPIPWTLALLTNQMILPTAATVYLHVIALLAAFIVIGVAIFTMAELAASVEGLTSAVELVRTVTDKLVVYDTDAVREVLKQTEDDARNAKIENESSEKVSAFRHTSAFIAPLHRMADNLDRFRMHIPHWVLVAAAGQDDDDEDDDDALLLDDDDESLTSQGLTGASPNGGNDKPTNPTPNSSNESTPHKKGTTPQHLELEVRSVESAHLGSSANGRGGNNTNNANNNNGTQSQDEPPKPVVRKKEEEGEWINTPMGMVFVAAKKKDEKKPEKKHSDKVPMGLFFFELTDAVEVTGQRRAEAMGRFVDRCHELAENTNGALHSFVSGQLVASWNAVHRVSNAESKATKFLLDLQTNSGDPLIRVYGAVVTGRARPYLAGNKRNQVQTITTLWSKALLGCALLAHKRRCMLIDATTRSACGSEFATRGYEALLCPVRQSNASHNAGAEKDAFECSQMSHENDNPQQNSSNNLIQNMHRPESPLGASRGGGTPSGKMKRSNSSFKYHNSGSGAGTATSNNSSASQSGNTTPAAPMAPQHQQQTSNTNNLNSTNSNNATPSSPGLLVTADSSSGNNPAAPTGANDYRSNGATEAHDLSPLSETTQTFVLFEVVAEKDGLDDEWMYKLSDTNKANGDDAVSNALLACLDGKYTQAVAQIKKIVDPAVRHDANVKRLLERAQLFAESGELDGIAGRSFAVPASL